MMRKAKGIVKSKAVLLLVLLLSGCGGWMPGRQAYWDEQVNDLCKKDGGVQIFQTLRITEEEANLLGRAFGRINIPIRQLADPNAPVYAEHKGTYLGGEGNVHIGRTESSIIRRRDGVEIARWVAYSRSGGEPAIGLSDGTTRFCPDLKSIEADLQRLFVVVGDAS
jgi:hypothetical protein